MAKLTGREQDVLGLMRFGNENDEIAREIFVSIHTVKVHVSSMMYKMNARNRTHLVYLALKQGLID